MGETAPTRRPRRNLALALALVVPVAFGASQVLPTGLKISPTASKGPSGGASQGPLTQAQHNTAATDRSKPAPRAATARTHSGHPAAIIDETSSQRVADVSADTSYDVPQAALHAYRQAAVTEATTTPSCHLSWGVLAAIGQVESDQGRYAGAVVLSNGTTYPTILGLELDGRGNVASIPDTDGGALDGDTVWDRAVGPMQFIPSTWAVVGADGDSDGRKNPNDFDDAALATANYLCGGGADMRVVVEARGAVYRYNHSGRYVSLVMSIARTYDDGGADVVPNTADPSRAQRRADAAAYRAEHRRTSSPDRPGTTRPPHRHHSADVPRSHRSGPDPKPVHYQPVPKPTPPPTTPPTTPPPTPPPTTPPPPVVTPLHGTFTVCGAFWCIGDTMVNFGIEPDLSVPQGDYDGDLTIEPVSTELLGLAGQLTDAEVGADGLVVTLNTLPYVFTPLGGTPPPTTAPPTTVAPTTLTPTTATPTTTAPTAG
jgi:membrane-bound lytic murein transglycosylase B